MGVILQVTDGEILIFFIRRHSLAVKLTICKSLSKSLGGKSFYSSKLVISWSKPLKIDPIFNGKFFVIFEFWLQ